MSISKKNVPIKYIGLIILSILVGTLSYYSLSFLSNYIVLSQRFIYIALAVISTMFIETTTRKTLGVFNTKVRLIALLFICLLFCFALIGGFYLFDKELFGWKFPAFMFYIVCLIWCTPISIGLTYCINVFIGSSAKEQDKAQFERRHLIILFLISFAFGMLYLYAYNPCITTGDSKGMWDTIHKLPGVELIDWIPPFYLYLNSFLIRIWDSLTIIGVHQIVLWSLIVVKATSFLGRYISKKYGIIFFIFTAMNYANVIQEVTFWKDAVFVPGMLWFTVCIAELMIDPCVSTKSIQWYVSIVISSLLTAFMRQSGIYVICVTLLTLLLLNRNKRVIITSVAIIVAILMIKGPIYTFLEVAPQPQMKYLAMGNDILYVYYNGGNLPEEGLAVVEEITNDNAENYQFNAYYANHNYYALWNYSIPEFISIYLKTFIREPQLLLKAVLTRTSIGWSIDKTIDQIDMLTCFTGERLDEVGAFDYHYPARVRNVATDSLDLIHQFLYRIPILYVLFWRTSLYLFCLIVGLIISIIRFNWRKAVLPSLPILVNFGTLIVSSAWADYRYYWPCNVLGIFLLFYFTALHSKEKTDGCIKAKRS